MRINDLQNAVNQIQLSESVKNKILYNCTESPKNTYTKHVIMCVITVFVIVSFVSSSIFGKPKSLDFSINIYAMEQQGQFAKYKIKEKAFVEIDECSYKILTSQNLILEAFEIGFSDENISNVSYTIKNGSFFEYCVLNEALYEKTFSELSDEGYLLIYKNNQYFLLDNLKESNSSSYYFTKDDTKSEDFIIRSVGNTYTQNSNSKVFVGVGFENNEIVDSIIEVNITFKDGKRFDKSITINQEFSENNDINILFSVLD